MQCTQKAPVGSSCPGWTCNEKPRIAICTCRTLNITGLPKDQWKRLSTHTHEDSAPRSSLVMHALHADTGPSGRSSCNAARESYSLSDWLRVAWKSHHTVDFQACLFLALSPRSRLCFALWCPTFRVQMSAVKQGTRHRNSHGRGELWPCIGYGV